MCLQRHQAPHALAVSAYLPLHGHSRKSLPAMGSMSNRIHQNAAAAQALGYPMVSAYMHAPVHTGHISLPIDIVACNGSDREKC